MSGGSAVYGGGGPAGDVYFNYTPLVDVTFNLIIYFVLTSTINTQAMARVIVPTVHDSAAVATEKLGTDRVVVNVVSGGTSVSARGDDPYTSDSGRAKGYEIDGVPISVGDMEKLVTTIKKKRDFIGRQPTAGKPENFYIEVRADFRVEYQDIEPILFAAAQAEIPKMNITTLVDLGRKEKE